MSILLFHVLNRWLRIHSFGRRDSAAKITQDKLFRRKRLSTGANFVHVYTEIWDNVSGKKEQQCDTLMFAFIKLYVIS